MSLLHNTPLPASAVEFSTPWQLQVRKGDVVTVKSRYASSRPYTALLSLHSEVLNVRFVDNLQSVAYSPVVELLLRDRSGGLGWHPADQFFPGRHTDKAPETSATSPEAQAPASPFDSPLLHTKGAKRLVIQRCSGRNAEESAAIHSALLALTKAEMLLEGLQNGRHVGTPRAREASFDPRSYPKDDQHYLG